MPLCVSFSSKEGMKNFQKWYHVNGFPKFKKSCLNLIRKSGTAGGRVFLFKKCFNRSLKLLFWIQEIHPALKKTGLHYRVTLTLQFISWHILLMKLYNTISKTAQKLLPANLEQFKQKKNI